MKNESLVKELSISYAFAFSRAYPTGYSTILYYPNNLNEIKMDLRKAFLSATGKEKLPNGVPTLIKKEAEQMLKAVEKIEREQDELERMTFALGRVPVTKKDIALARRRITIAQKKVVQELLLKNGIREQVKEAYHQCEYRQSQSSWAGEDHFLTVGVGGKPDCQGYSDKVWSSNGKCYDSFHKLWVRENWPVEVAEKGIAVVDGLLTLDANLIETKDEYKVFEASWVQQGRGFELNLQKGLIVQVGDKTYHKKTIQAAHRQVKSYQREFSSTLSIDSQDAIAQ